MGSSGSKQSSSVPIAPQPVRAGSAPQRTVRVMTPQIRIEILDATQRAFGNLEYGVIGGTALAEYGNRRAISDVKIMVPNKIIGIAEDHLLQRGMIRTAGRGIGYLASDGNCYGIDITSDLAVGQTFRSPGGRHHIMTADFLLNSKAYSYSTRIGPGMERGKLNDAHDIMFLVDYMRRQRVILDKRQCRWLVDYDFWTAFCTNYQGAEQAFNALGFYRDPTPSSSNRNSRLSSRQVGRNGNNR